MFSQKWFQPNVSIILNRFSPIYTEVRDQETRKELSRANFLISFPPFFATKYGKIIIQHCLGWLSIGIGFLRHSSSRSDLIYCGTKVHSDILYTYDTQRFWIFHCIYLPQNQFILFLYKKNGPNNLSVTCLK